MRITFKGNKDHCAAALLVVLGGFVVARSYRYDIGSISQMGAGFVPVVLGLALIAVGLALGVSAHARVARPVRRPEWRGGFCILAGVLAFAILGEYGGFVPAAFASVFVSALGDRKNSLRVAILLAAAVTVVGVLVFNYGLRLNFPLFRWG